MNVTEGVAPSLPLAAGPGVRVRRQVGGWVLPAADLGTLVSLIPVLRVAWLPGVVFALVATGVLGAQGQHRRRICLRVPDQLPQLAIASGVAVAVLLPWFSAGFLLLLGGVALLALPVARGFLYAALRAGYRRGFLNEPTLIVGAGELGRQVAAAADEHPEFGLRVRGFVDGPADVDRLLGRPEELPEVVAAHGITRVLVCDDGDADLVGVLRVCRPLAAEVYVVPRLHELGMALPRASIDEIWGVPLIPLRRQSRFSAPAKRVFDVVLSGLMLLLLGPLLLVLAGFGGRTFFRQRRVTGAGKTSEVIKLRTLRAGTRQDWTVTDAQCTRLQRWLRRTHLDELPQLVNVLRGEMSVVGPRPERPYYAARFGHQIPRYSDRHRMPGGMTGWAQIHGLHGDTSIPDRARFDNHYIEYWSPWLDVVIVARTVAVVFRAALRDR